jgi:hypothetical protein
MLRRTVAVSGVAFVSIASLFFASPAGAASPLKGTALCSIAGDIRFPAHGLSNTPSTKPVGIKINKPNRSSSCDGSGVTGAAAPVVGVVLQLNGHLHKGATCDGLWSAPQFDTTTLHVQWLGQKAGSTKVKPVASSNGHAATVSYDAATNALNITSTPLTGAFAGETLTLHLGLDTTAAAAHTDCTTGALAGTAFGVGNPATVSVS